MSAPPDAALPEAELRPRRQFQFIWLVPLVAVLVAAWLAYTTIQSRGPTITISFTSAEGLQAGQTKVRHKAVELGVVDSVSLSDDLSRVNVRVKMHREAISQLTDKAHFWVVRPRLSAGNISGLDTLVSGAYIELDAGATAADAAGGARREFVGLDLPPAIRSNEPGQTYRLRTPRIAGVSVGSPVLYRDIEVGEVLSWQLDESGGGFLIEIFVRKPYDRFVRGGTYFWNSSGLALDLGANGVKLRLESLQAVLSGAIAFNIDAEGRALPASAPGTEFRLYSDEQAALSAGFKRRVPFVTRFEGSVRGLAVGAPVEIFGIPIGLVTGVKLVLDPTGTESYVEVRFEVMPEKILPAALVTDLPPLAAARTLVARGLRMQLHTANYLTGQLVLGMDFVPGSRMADVQALPDGTIMVPSQSGGFDNLVASATELTQGLARIPFDQIGQDVARITASISKITGGGELKSSLASLSGALAGVQDLVRKFDAGASPALKRLPEIAQELAAVLGHTDRLISSTDTAYGGNSQIKRDLERLLAQVNDTSRSVRLLADYLAQHPESLIQGRTGRGAER
jgi:paraquat-inducible protein B